MLDVLIVEDGKLERERLHSVLGQAGFRVQAVSSVQAAEQALAEESFRLVILDIGLGDRSGSYLFSILQQRQQDCSVIIFTGNPSPHLRQRFIDEGADDFIVKGSKQASSENILARVQALLGEAVVAQQGQAMDLPDFLARFLKDQSQNAFVDQSGQFWPCAQCSGVQYEVAFQTDQQSPPDIIGKIRCKHCGTEMDPEIS
jgi:DNA-binding response OmpR family regulator